MPAGENTIKRNVLQKEKTVARPVSAKGRTHDARPSWERFKKVTGAFLLLVAVFLFFGFTSYLIGWFKGESDDIVSGISFGRILFDDNLTVHNWTGRLGAALSNLFIKQWFGIASYFILVMFFFSGLRMLFHARVSLKKVFGYCLPAMLWLSVALGFLYSGSDTYSLLGGTFGYQATLWFNGILGKLGTGFLLLFLALAYLIIAFNISFRRRRRDESAMAETPAAVKAGKAGNKVLMPQGEKVTGLHEFEEDKPSEVAPAATTGGIDLEVASFREELAKEEEAQGKNGDYGSLSSLYDPLLDLPDYKYPPLDLLNNYDESSAGVHKEELEANKDRIVATLNNYDISIDKIKATIGPAVTLYEIIPSPGVRISKIKSLEDDIALSLSALGIRIIAPLPGKGTIGIEVPNQNAEIVSIKSVMASERFQNTKYALPFALGKTISNESYIADLTKMPHILMAGATGQGKSVGLNAIITSLLYKKHPAQLKFVLVDPKKVELSLFSKIERHFLAKLPDLEEAIITETRQVVRTLFSLNIEMDSRYDLMRDAGVRNIYEYNVKFLSRRLNPNEGHRFLPYIVVVVDEFADLIMTAGKEIETPLTRLAQLARAIGIHLIIATQRPSVNIITGLIKANFPTRIAFRVISKIDSRTILDSNGADQLIGRGDMLISTGNDMVRLQCAFVDVDEVERVSEYIGSQRGYPTAFNLPEYFDEKDEPNKEFDPNERDELFEEAARLVVQYQHGSTSLLQRKLKLGYNRAGRIIDQLEAVGIVGPFEGSKAREVKVKTEMELEQYLKDFTQTKL